MKWIKTLSAIFFLGFLFINKSQAQYEDAGQYMNYVSKQNEDLTLIYLSYVSAASHGKSARKVEKRRLEVVDAISRTRFNIQGMPPWKGDRSYRDSTVSYLKLLNIVFNEDYAKIVDMEDIAEQSYDAMEAYMLAQQKAQEKLNEAIDQQNKIQREFGTKYNVNIVDDETEISKKSQIASDLFKHYDQVYLIFFKANKQEAYLMEAVNNKNINAVEQNKNSLEKFAEEGLTKLKDVKAFNNDPSMINACRQTLVFYKMEASQMKSMTDFFLKEDNFNKAKKNFETKPSSKRTQQDIDDYNRAVNDFNSAVNNYNATNKELNKERSAAIDEWNNTVKKFLDDYMPVQRKVTVKNN
jgi:hypothetical protein